MTKEGKENRWGEVLRVCMDELEKMYPDMNDAQIADKIGMPRPTFNRLKNGKFRGETPVPSEGNIVKLLSGSGNAALAADIPGCILNEAIRGMLVSKASTEGADTDADGKFLANTKMERLFKKSENFLAYELAAKKGGADEGQLVRILGRKGIKAAEELRKCGIVYREGGRYFVERAGILVRNYDNLKNQIRILLEHYDTEHFGKKGNYLHTFSDGLNEEGLAAVRDVHCRYYRELKSVYRDKGFRGENLSFSGAFGDVLDRENIK